MADDFYRVQKEREQELERARTQSHSHSTMETYQIEQGEANVGHIPSPKGADVVPPAPTLLQRILKALGLRK